jgi:hypothetical protein
MAGEQLSRVAATATPPVRISEIAPAPVTTARPPTLAGQRKEDES